MSRARGHIALLVALLAGGAVGCWEQWSNAWFPQMKWQKTLQAFEATDHDGKVDLLMPPEGTLALGAEPEIDPNDDAAMDALVNPRPMSLESLENGRTQFETFCLPCHGSKGLGDGPVSMLGPIQGPFAAVLPIAGPASIARARSDGNIFTTIRYGRRRMPSYQRIPISDRWDIVNYLRYLNGQRGVAMQGDSQ